MFTNQSPVRLPKTQDEIMLTLLWRSFSRWGREHVTFGFHFKCGHYLIFGCLQAIAFYITKIQYQKLLRLHWRWFSGWCRYYVYLGRLPTARLWMAETNRDLGYTTYRAKNRSHSVDALFHNGAVAVSFIVLPRKGTRTLVMGSSDQGTFQLPYWQD